MTRMVIRRAALVESAANDYGTGANVAADTTVGQTAGNAVGNAAGSAAGNAAESATDKGTDNADDKGTDNADDNAADSAASTGKKPRKSAAGRRLMRWDVGTDQHVLLAVEYVCARDGIPVPWEAVAEIITPHLSGEAIKQHLAKVRKARVSDDLPVPPVFDRVARRKAMAAAAAASGIKATPTPVKGRAKADKEEDDTAKRSTLLPPPKRSSTKKSAAAVSPTRRGKGRMSFGGQVTPTMRKSTVAVGSKRGRAKSFVPDEHGGNEILNSEGLTKRLRPLETKDYREPALSDDEDFATPQKSGESSDDESFNAGIDKGGAGHNNVMAASQTFASDCKSPSVNEGHGHNVHPNMRFPYAPMVDDDVFAVNDNQQMGNLGGMFGLPGQLENANLGHGYNDNNEATIPPAFGQNIMDAAYDQMAGMAQNNHDSFGMDPDDEGFGNIPIGFVGNQQMANDPQGGLGATLIRPAAAFTVDNLDPTGISRQQPLGPNASFDSGFGTSMPSSPMEGSRINLAMGVPRMNYQMENIGGFPAQHPGGATLEEDMFVLDGQDSINWGD